MKEENSCQSEEVVLARDRRLCLGQWQRTGRGLWHPREIQFARTGSPGSARHDFWLGNRKVGSQVIGIEELGEEQ